jgi:hypothetical protein
VKARLVRCARDPFLHPACDNTVIVLSCEDYSNQQCIIIASECPANVYILERCSAVGLNTYDVLRKRAGALVALPCCSTREILCEFICALKVFIGVNTSSVSELFVNVLTLLGTKRRRTVYAG